MAKELCKPGISAKFFKNPELAKMFEVTGNKLLVEACYEKLWGTGIPLHHQDCLNKEKWNNKGITGRARLIRSHSLARICFELSRNSN